LTLHVLLNRSVLKWLQKQDDDDDDDDKSRMAAGNLLEILTINLM